MVLSELGIWKQGVLFAHQRMYRYFYYQYLNHRGIGQFFLGTVAISLITNILFFNVLRGGWQGEVSYVILVFCFFF